MKKTQSKRLTLTLLYSCGLYLTSCTTYLTPAIVGNNMGYQPKPLATDSIHVKHYITGSYAGAASPGKSVNFELGMLNINRAHSYKSINFSYGLMGYFGKADYNTLHYDPVNETINTLPSFNKSVHGFGARTSIGYHITSESGNADFRIINWENSFTKETGDYTDFRKAMRNQTELFYRTYVSDKNQLWTTGLSTEIAWKSKSDDFRHAFRLFLGTTPGLYKNLRKNSDSDIYDDDDRDSPAAFSFNYYMQVKRFFLIYELGANFNVSQKISLGIAF